MKKTYVIDTSVLLYDLDSLFRFEENQVIIPSIVMEELDHLKGEASERGYSARRTLEILEELTEVRPLVDGVYLSEIPETSSVYASAKGLSTHIVKSYKIYNEPLERKVTNANNDHRIIACAMNHLGILVSRDRSMRVLARDFVTAQDYKADSIKTRDIYKGYRRVTGSAEEICQLYKGELKDRFGLHPNEFLILENEENPKQTGIGIRKKDGIRPCDFKNLNLKTKPLNLEQKMFLHLLMDEDILCVSATGVSGKGKSLLSVDYALSKVGEQRYAKLLYSKPATPLDKNEYLGYTKGDMDDKMKPHLQPLYSSIEFLYKKQLYSEKGLRTKVDTVVDKLMDDDVLNFCPLVNIRGMSIFDKVVILDEAQNTTNHMMKSLVTRVNDSSKLIVLGDVEQIDDRNLNKFNNGMAHLIEEGKDEYVIGHICMDIDPGSRRGKLAEFGAKKL